MIAPRLPRLSAVRQCVLVGLNRSGVYHQPKGESEATLALMRLIDEVFLKHPFYGTRQMMLHLRITEPNKASTIQSHRDIGGKTGKRLSIWFCSSLLAI